MIKKTIALVLCLTFLSMATAVFAEGVFITKNGKKYHTEVCPLIKNKGPQATSMKEALEKGLKPCKKCSKDDVSSNKADGKKQVVSRTKSKAEVD